MKKIAVLFPGIGYQFDRPLLHFAAEQALQYGYEVLQVPYSGFPGKIRGDAEKMRESLDIAVKQTEDILKDARWDSYERIVFVSKSIGTIAAANYAHRHGIRADHILFTPFPETFADLITGGKMIAFHSETDPWMDDDEVTAAAARAGVPMMTWPDGNHSLETGNAVKDIRRLEEIFKATEKIFAADKSDAWTDA